MKEKTSFVGFLLAIPLFICLFLSAAEGKKDTEKDMEKQGMVAVRSICPSVKVSLMYSRADNFTGKILYRSLTDAYLHPEAAKAVAKAQKILKARYPHLSLKIYDAARPMSVQQIMWNAVAGTSKNIYVSNPANGGGLHNYGLAVDLTLCRQNGDTIPMGTTIDYLGKLAHIDQENKHILSGKLSKEAVSNRKILRSVMVEAGFKPLKSEWWHFNFKTRAEAKAHYKVIK